MADTNTATEVPPERARELIAGGVQLLDVRHPDEHELGHIEGDELVPFDMLSARAESLDRENALVLYCRSGDRSGAAAQALRASGYDAYSIEGGLLAWTEQGLPIEPPDGTVGQPSGLPPA